MTQGADEASGIHDRPAPFSRYTTLEMWNDEHISRGMLECHLNESSNSASRNRAFLERSLSWTTSYFNLSPSTSIVDFGCGPGLYTNEWARTGARVTGIDVSRRSIAYAVETANRKGLSITYINDDYLRCRLPDRYDLITMIFCDYCALSPPQRRRLLRKWKSILKPDGKVLFDVNTISHFQSIGESHSYTYAPHGGFWSAEPYREYESTFRYETLKLLVDQITVVEANRTRTFFNWLQCFSIETLAAELHTEGLFVLHRFGNVAGDPYTDDSTELAVVVAADGGPNSRVAHMAKRTSVKTARSFERA